MKRQKARQSYQDPKNAQRKRQEANYHLYVHQHHCFPNTKILKDLWNSLFEKVELTEIMRQRNDAVFANMLNRLRVRKEDEPLQETDIKLLESRTVKENSLTAPPDALLLFYRNNDVSKHNDAKIASLSTEKYTVQAEDVDQWWQDCQSQYNTP